MGIQQSIESSGSEYIYIHNMHVILLYMYFERYYLDWDLRVYVERNHLYVHMWKNLIPILDTPNLLPYKINRSETL
jgi:hypothetical protein